MIKTISYLENNFIRPKKNRKSRIEWIDVAKGIGIFFVFYGHIMYQSSIPEINTAIYAFHVPFFFILSGFVFTLKDDISFLRFMKSKVTRLLIPFIIFTLFSYWIAVNLYHVEDQEALKRLLTYYDGSNKYNPPIWFLITLFMVYIVAYFIDVPNRKIFSKFGLSITFLLIGYFIYKYMHFANSLNKVGNLVIYYGMDKAIIATGFFIMGSFFRSVRKIIPKYLRMPLLHPLLIPSILLWVIYGCYLNTKASLYGMNVGNYWYFVASGSFGSLTFIILSVYISQLKITCYIVSRWGQNTLFITATHDISAIGIVAKYLNWTQPIWYTWKFDLYTPFFVISMLIGYSFILCPIVDRYLPILSGKDPYFYKELFIKIKTKIISKKANQS